MNDITVLIIIKDAEATLDTCLSSVAWADDVFCIIDPSSSDRSLEIAQSHSDHVVEHEFEGYGAQRNWGIPQITTEWTLVLDSDEWVLDPLSDRIQELIKTPTSLNGYSIKRLTYFFGRLIKYCGWQRDYNIRLFRTQKGEYNNRLVHESMIIEGELGIIDEVMLHDSYRSFDDYMEKLIRFNALGAQDRFDKGKKFKYIDLMFRPIWCFFRMYILRRGFLDGIHGLVLCGQASCGVFIRYAYLWNLHRIHKAA